MRLQLAIAIAAVVVAGSAFAASSPVTGSFNVTATVANSCLVTSTSNIAFGAYDPADTNATANLDAQGSVNVRCTRGTVANVALGQGNNAAAGSTCIGPLRQMAAGVERLRYDVYQNAPRTTTWGCDTTNDQTFTSTSSILPTTLTTYGRIPAGQNVAAGSFNDTVTVTVTF